MSIRQIVNRLRALVRHKALDEDLDAELDAHLQMAIGDNIRQGMPPEQARRDALIRIGGLEQARQQHRDSRGLPALETWMQDIRYSYRTLRRDAAFAAFAILIAGLGVGASTTVFSVVNALMLRPLPVHDPDSLVWIANNGDLPGETVQLVHLRNLRAQSRAFVDAAGYNWFYSTGNAKLTGSGEPERLTEVEVSENFFPVLGVQPAIGRWFSAEECTANGPHAALLSHGLWQRRFGSDPGILGRSLTLNDQAVTVVGVLPESFDFASLFAPGTRVDLFRPFPFNEENNRRGNTLALIGRLSPGATPRAAQAEVNVIFERNKRDLPGQNTFHPRVDTLRQRVSGTFRPAMFVLACAVGMVMLIVCANLSNLLLARTATREKEMAIRATLGAGRARLIRQVLTESVVLAVTGGILGLLLAITSTTLLSRLDASIPLLAEVRVDPQALAFTLMAAMLTGILFGLTPALRLSSMSPALKESGRGSTAGKRHGWIRNALVVCEVAFACVLLVGAGLLLRSFLRVLDQDLGFRPESAVTLRIDPGSQYSTQVLRNAFYDETLRRVRSVPGVQSAGVTDALPFGSNRSWGIGFAGSRKFTEHDYPEAFIRIVSDGYFGAMGIPIRAGRDFTPADNASAEKVIIINETLARVLFPGQDPIGQMMQSDRPPRRVVGVVRDIRHMSHEREAGSELYIPIRQTYDYWSVNLVVRGQAFTSGVREALRSMDPNLPVNEFRPIQGMVEKSVSPRRLIVLLLGGFAAFALILAALGIYGVISYSVKQRTQEIGIRIALGAPAAALERRILRETLQLAAAGIALGSLASWLLGRIIQGLLFGVSSSDPLTFAAMAAILIAVAAVAGYIPARHASHIDPVEAMRAG